MDVDAGLPAHLSLNGAALENLEVLENGDGGATGGCRYGQQHLVWTPAGTFPHPAVALPLTQPAWPPYPIVTHSPCPTPRPDKCMPHPHEPLHPHRNLNPLMLTNTFLGPHHHQARCCRCWTTARRPSAAAACASGCAAPWAASQPYATGRTQWRHSAGPWRTRRGRRGSCWQVGRQRKPGEDAARGEVVLQRGAAPTDVPMHVCCTLKNTRPHRPLGVCHVGVATPAAIAHAMHLCINPDRPLGATQ